MLEMVHLCKKSGISSPEVKKACTATIDWYLRPSRRLVLKLYSIPDVRVAVDTGLMKLKFHRTLHTFTASLQSRPEPRISDGTLKCAAWKGALLLSQEMRPPINTHEKWRLKNE